MVEWTDEKNQKFQNYKCKTIEKLRAGSEMLHNLQANKLAQHSSMGEKTEDSWVRGMDTWRGKQVSVSLLPRHTPHPQL